MGEVNYNIPESIIEIFKNAKKSYEKAQENIEQFGEIVSHPRTGSPIENPYLSVREKCSKQMVSISLKYKRINLCFQDKNKK